MHIFHRALLAGSLVAASAAALAPMPALAGQDVGYGPAPGWINRDHYASGYLGSLTSGAGPAQVLWDWQYRLDGGTVHAYTDRAVRIDNPQMQMEENQISLSWLPDKGDITVHRFELHRAGEVVDLLADGLRFEVLRREMGLEERLLDGELTATVSVPGLRVGDVLRIAHSVSTSDQALGEEMQALHYLHAEPWQAGRARVMMSWPSDAPMAWRAEDRVALADPVTKDGFSTLTLDLPLARPPAVPRDAPARFHRPAILRVGSFSGWEEVSAVMAPHYAAAARISDGSPVAAEAARIMARTRDPRERAALAVRLVQEEVSYLLDGLNGGNYLPQPAETTWALRYGDCKAKTVLLLALLDEMGIKGEAVLVSTRGGDGVPELLPMPGAFDHVIVHTVIEGVDYWLDGTLNGTRLATMSDVPPFFHALPIRKGGAGLVPITPRAPKEPNMVMTMTLDHRAGVDFPALFSTQMQVAGPAGVGLRALVDERNPEVLREIARRYAETGADLLVTHVGIDYDEERAIAQVIVEGVAPATFEWAEGRLRAPGEAFDQAQEFNPDRARRAWQDIPVAMPGPLRQRATFTTILPQAGAGFRLEGKADFSGGFGHVELSRQARIEAGAMQILNEVVMLPGEIAPADLPEARRAARRLASETLELVPPEDVVWRWELDERQRAERAGPILAAYQAAIDFAQADDFGPLQRRAAFLMSIYDFRGALADIDRLLEASPSAWAYWQRADIRRALGDEAAALADLEAAFDLDPANETGREIASRLAYAGRIEEARDLIESLPVSEEDRIDHTNALAAVLAIAGDVAEGHHLLEEALARQPQNPAALNGDCWFRGLFSFALDTAMARCTQAVERASMPYAALDSRALIHFRAGRYQEAIADLDAALQLVPGLAESMYLRGVARLHAGDRAGRDDIATASLISPHLPGFYRFHGIAPPR